MRAIKVYCPPGVEPPLYAFIDALDGKLKAIRSNLERCLGMVKAQFPDKVPLIQEMIRSIR